MQVRGAPALGAAAALGMYLGVKDCVCPDWGNFSRKLDAVAKYIGSSRPTARNLFWGMEIIQAVARANKKQPIEKIKEIILRQAQAIIREDMVSCRQIGAFIEVRGHFDRVASAVIG